MASAYNNWEQFNHRYNLIFNGIIALPLIPFALIFLETQGEFPEGPKLVGSFAVAIKVLLCVVAALSIAYAQMYKKRIPDVVKSVQGIEEKLKVYLSKKTAQYLILGVAVLAAMVGLYLTKDQMFSGVYIAVLFTYSLSRPTFDSVVNETGVPEQELKSWGEGHNKKGR
jgi:hypothetical protein